MTKLLSVASPLVYSEQEWVQHYAPEGDFFGALAEWLQRRRHRSPFILGVCGSVAAGKSTFCESLRSALEGKRDGPRVDVVSTDSFLFPNRELEARGIMRRKGFPESYDGDRFDAFVTAVRRREGADVPLYSHDVYDVTDRTQRIENPDVLILEGVAAMRRPEGLDLSIYLDAETAHIERWYLDRVLALRDGAREGSFYWHFRRIARDEFAELARRVWQEVNLVNLEEHILPLRDVADVTVRKASDHTVESVRLATTGEPT